MSLSWAGRALVPFDPVCKKKRVFVMSDGKNKRENPFYPLVPVSPLRQGRSGLLFTDFQDAWRGSASISWEVYETVLGSFEEARFAFRFDFFQAVHTISPENIQALYDSHVRPYVAAIQQMQRVVPGDSLASKALRAFLALPLCDAIVDDIRTLPLRLWQKAELRQEIARQTGLSLS